ncbi:MAG: thermitase [Psychromonas sp.]|jgi:thermitase
MSIAVPATDNIAVTKVVLYIDGQLKAQANMSELSCCWHSRNAASGFHLI